MKLEKAFSISLPTGVLGLAGVADGSKLYAACIDGMIFEITPPGQEKTAFHTPHSSYASGCVLLPDGKTLISAGYDGCLIWHDTTTRQSIRRVVAHDFWSWKLALSGDGKWLCSVTGQFLAGGPKYEPAPISAPTVKIFDAVTGELRASIHHPPPVLSTAFSPDGRQVAAANLMGEIGIWDVATGKERAKIQTSDFTSWGIIKSPHYLGGIYGLCFSPEGSGLYCCGMGPMSDPMAGNGKMTWQRWAWKEVPAKRVGEVRDGEHGTGLMETLGFAPDGKSFLMAGRQAQGTGNLAIYSEANGERMATLDVKSRVTGHHFTSDGKRVFLGIAAGQPQRKDGKWPDYGHIHEILLTPT